MILTYGLSPQVFQQLEDLAKNYEEELKAISPEEALYTAGHLAGLKDADHRKFHKEDYPENMEFLLFCQTSRDSLYGFLKEAAKAGLNFPHKAMLTETTKNWPFSYLLGHIAQEHQMVQAYNQLGQKLKPYLNIEDKDLQNLIQEIKDLPKASEDLDLADVKAMEEKFDQLIKDKNL